MGRNDQLAIELRNHPARAALGAIALESLSRQAEGRVLFVGREYIRRQAKELGLEREAAHTSLCNALDLLERGPENASERWLIVLLATLGLEDAMDKQPEQAQALMDRALRHAMWLEVATELPWLSAIVQQLKEEHFLTYFHRAALRFFEQLEQEKALRPQSSAHALALLTAWAQRKDYSAFSQALSPPHPLGIQLKQLYSLLELVPSSPTRATASVLEGELAPLPPPPWLQLLQWLSGWALLRAFWRFVLWLLGRKSKVRLEIIGPSLRITKTTNLLQRKLEEEVDWLSVPALLSIERKASVRGLILGIGVVSFSFGLLIGGWFGFEGIRTESMPLLHWGALWLIGGTLADFGANWLASRVPFRSEIRLHVRGKSPLCLRADHHSICAFANALQTELLRLFPLQKSTCLPLTNPPKEG
ncbi:MAG: hypothetical protein N2515_06095 [Deltaproteobacteria bacterium]|nr:hypothetical protein [Deltaproteobacteria bacterium]